MEFKDKLKELRLSQKISQQQLADYLNISRSVVAKWETGLAIPNDINSNLLCEYFNISKDELFPNSDIEKLLVEKNIEIKKSRRFLNILIIAVSIAVFVITSVLVTNYILLTKRIKSRNDIIPEITNLFFNYHVEYEDEKFITNFENNFLLFAKTEHNAYITIIVDKLHLDGYYDIEVLIDGCQVVRCDRLDISHIGENKYEIVYKVTFKIIDELISELKLTSVKFNQSADGVDEVRDCMISCQQVPVYVEREKFAIVSVKLNAQTLISFTIPKGLTIAETILENSYQMDMLDLILENTLDPSFGYHNFIFNGWYRSDGLSLDEKVYSDVFLLADITYNSESVVDVKVMETSISLYNLEYKPTFIVNNYVYNDAIFEMESLSNNVEIINKTLLKAVRPGDAEIKIKYSFGFYEGQTTVKLNVLDFAYVEIFSYQKEIEENSGIFETKFKAYYDSEVEDVVMQQFIIDDAINYFNECNLQFKNKTGYSRILKELKRVSEILYVPVFETDYIEENSAITIAFEGHKFNVDSIPQSISVPIGTVLDSSNIMYKTENIQYDYIRSVIFYEDYNNVIKENIVMGAGKFKLFFQLSYINEGISYYTDVFQIEVIAE